MSEADLKYAATIMARRITTLEAQLEECKSSRAKLILENETLKENARIAQMRKGGNHDSGRPDQHH